MSPFPPHLPLSLSLPFSESQFLHAMTRGRATVATSGALGAMEMRAPYDVANLATLWGAPGFAAGQAQLSEVCE